MFYVRMRRREGFIVRTFLNVVSQRPHSDGHSPKTRRKERERKAKRKKEKPKEQRGEGGIRGRDEDGKEIERS